MNWEYKTKHEIWALVAIDIKFIIIIDYSLRYFNVIVMVNFHNKLNWK